MKLTSNSGSTTGPWSEFSEEMEAFDNLPDEFKQFVRNANNQWACVPMLKRAKRCGRSAYGTKSRLLQMYLTEDRGRMPSCT